MIKNITFSLILLISFSGFGQDAVENQINEIRKRFYALDDSKLNKLVIEDHHFYLENAKIKKVVVKTDTTRFEYYFDLDFIRNHAYFIYSIDSKNNKREENRYYFRKGGELIRWLDHTKNEVVLNEQLCPKRLKLIAQSQDLLTLCNNYLLDKRNPQNRNLVNEINSEVNKLKTEIFAIDTIEVLNVPDEYYYSHKIESKNKKGIIIKLLSFEGGDHASTTQTSFFNKTGQIIYEISMSNDVFGHSSMHHKYYKEGVSFRVIKQISKTHEIWTGSSCVGFKHTFEDEIYDY